MDWSRPAGTEELPLKIGQAITIEAFDPPIFASLCSPNLNTTRKELAQHYLSRSSISPGEISYLLGFQESSSFIRSFRGWTGITPGEYRRAQSDVESALH